MPQATPVFPMHLKLNRVLAASRVIGTILTVIGICSIYIFLARVQWRPFINAAALVAVAMAFIYASVAFSGGKPLGALYTPHGKS